MIRRSGTKVAL